MAGRLAWVCIRPLPPAPRDVWRRTDSFARNANRIGWTPSANTGHNSSFSRGNVLLAHNNDSVVDSMIFIVVLALFWYWGVKSYRKAADNTTWRDRVSLAGLAAPLVSCGVWLVTVMWAWAIGTTLSAGSTFSNPNPAIHHLTGIGAIWIPGFGIIAGSVGRPRLILPVVLTGISTVLFWFVTCGALAV